MINEVSLQIIILAREGLRIIKDEVIFISDLGEKKIFVCSNDLGPYFVLLNFQNFSYFKFIV